MLYFTSELFCYHGCVLCGCEWLVHILIDLWTCFLRMQWAGTTRRQFGHKPNYDWHNFDVLALGIASCRALGTWHLRKRRNDQITLSSICSLHHSSMQSFWTTPSWILGLYTFNSPMFITKYMYQTSSSNICIFTKVRILSFQDKLQIISQKILNSWLLIGKEFAEVTFVSDWHDYNWHKSSLRYLSYLLLKTKHTFHLQ